MIIKFFWDGMVEDDGEYYETSFKNHAIIQFLFSSILSSPSFSIFYKC